MTLPCPVCGTAAAFDARHPEADLYRCPACGHCFSDPSGAPETYDPSYFRDAHRNWFAHPDYAMFGRIERAIGQPRAILDVGCGIGDLLAYLRPRLPSARLVGIDLAAPAPVPGVEFVQGDIMQTEIADSYDVVVTLQTIEHIGAVQPFAARLAALCRPGGLVIVGTVNERSTVYRAARALKTLGMSTAFNRLYSRHHVNHFSVPSLRRLVTGAGLAVVSEAVHNYPLAKVDVPQAGPLMSAAYRAAVAALFSVGPGVLQTLVCRR